MNYEGSQTGGSTSFKIDTSTWIRGL